MKRLIVLMALVLMVGRSAVTWGDDAKAHGGVDCLAPAPDDLGRCVANRREAWQHRGIVGILMHPDEPTEDGGRWRIRRTAPGGPAEEAGIRPDDVIVAWGGERLAVADAAMDRALEAVRVGDLVAVVVERDGVERSFELRARAPTVDIFEYWLLTYVHQHFPEDAVQRYEAQVEQRLEHPGQRR